MLDISPKIARENFDGHYLLDNSETKEIIWDNRNYVFLGNTIIIKNALLLINGKEVYIKKNNKFIYDNREFSVKISSYGLIISDNNFIHNYTKFNESCKINFQKFNKDSTITLILNNQGDYIHIKVAKIFLDEESDSNISTSEFEGVIYNFIIFEQYLFCTILDPNEDGYDFKKFYQGKFQNEYILFTEISDSSFFKVPTRNLFDW